MKWNWILQVFDWKIISYRLFADDILLYKTIKTSDDHQILQNDLNSLTKWSVDWLMDFNISKCKVLQITTHHNKSSFTYKMFDTPLDITTLVSVSTTNYHGNLISTTSVLRQIVYWDF